MKKVDEHLIKISAGYIVTPDSLELGSNVKIVVDGDVTKIEQKDNQDGTYNQVYTVKGIIAEVIHEQ